MKIKVYIVDDHRLFVDGLKALLSKVSDVEVVGCSHSGKICLDELKKFEVDVLLTDITMPEMTGDVLIGHVKNMYSHINVLTLSMHTDFEYVNKMVEAGTTGYILKNTDTKELRNAIRFVNDGRTYFSSEINESIVEGYSKGNINSFKAIAKEKDDIFLTPREKEVLRLVINGYNSATIADMLDISYHTITSHRKNINSKIGVSSLVELVKIVNDKGLL